MMVATATAVALTASTMTAQAAAPPAWTITESMGSARALHTATLLPDGDVLVAGGMDLSNVLGSAERYDFSDGTWSTATSMGSPRVEHTATPLADGTVLVAGGGDGPSVLTSSEIYDPVTDTWSAAGAMTVPRRGHAAVRLADGRILAIGGVSDSGSLASTDIYDPATRTWSTGAPTAVARSSTAATLLGDGSVLVAGGFAAGGGSHSTAERYDPASDSWTAAGSMVATRAGHTATTLPDGSALVVGGWGATAPQPSAERYDPATGTWSSAGTMRDRRAGGRATLLANGAVLVSGGYDTASAEIYDPVSGSWFAAGQMHGIGYVHTATLLPDATVLVAGGDHFGFRTSSAERFSLVTAIDFPTVDFGDQPVGLNRTELVPIRNSGEVPLFVTEVALRGAAADDFTIGYDSCSGNRAIGPRETCLIRVGFKPKAAGGRSAALVLDGNTVASSASIPLTGTGLAPASAVRVARTPTLRCVKTRPGRVACSGLRAGTTKKRVAVRLSRRSKVFATGELRRGGKLRLRLNRPLLLRRYALRIGEPGGRRMVVRVASVGR